MTIYYFTHICIYYTIKITLQYFYRSVNIFHVPIALLNPFNGLKSIWGLFRIMVFLPQAQ